MSKIEKEETSAVFMPQVDITASTEKNLRLLLKDLLAGGIVTLTVDLTGVKMVDSVGIGLLISVHNSLRKVGGSLMLINVSKDLVDLFANMRLNQHFTIKPA